MTILTFTLLVLAGSIASGAMGALTGLGGGTIIIPILVLGFHVNIQYAIGASLVSVVATSCGAAAASAREGFSNLRVGIVLELAATIGALAAAHAASLVPERAIEFVFAAVLLYSAWQSLHPPVKSTDVEKPDPLAERLGLDGTYPGPDGPVAYCARAVPKGLAVMGIAGVISGLLGIGSGALKVLAMDHYMRLPFKVSTATSNFMIGVTAAASAGVYLNRGYVAPGVAMPVMLGTLAGSLIGAKILVHARVSILREIFTVVIGLMGLQMMLKAFGYAF